MTRSLFTLLFVAGLGASTPATDVDVFDMTSLLEVAPIPSHSGDSVAPEVEADAALIMDGETGILLYAKNIHERVPMASLTKIMTAIVIMENHDLDEIVQVQNTYPGQELGVRIWLQKWEKITVGDLLIGLLVRSGGDAAMALAEHHSGDVDGFVEAMNAKLKELNLENTNFTNPIGLDHEDHYSSAFDLAIMTKHALKNKDFRRIVNLKKATVKSTDGRLSHTFDNTNYLLNSYLDIRGVKTGTTKAAGPSLVNLAVNARGNEVISVVLNSPARFSENKSLIDWSFRSHKW